MADDYDGKHRDENWRGGRVGKMERRDRLEQAARWDDSDADRSEGNDRYSNGKSKKS